MTVPRIVLLGAGYGCLMAMKQLQKELHYNEAEVFLINPHNYHYITTKLHESAAGTIHSKDVRIALSSILNPKKVTFIQDRVNKISVEEKRVHMEKTSSLDYDYLVIGLGSIPETYGIKGMKENAFFIKDLDSVCHIRRHMEYMLTTYKKTKDPSYATFVVGGAGFTGIEYIGELVAHFPSLCQELDIPLDQLRIVNIEALPTILPGFDTDLVNYTKHYLEKKGVAFILNTPIEECTEEGVVLKGGEMIRSKTVIWTGGIRGNTIMEESILETVRGRVKVDPFLRAPGNEEVFVLGDCSLVFQGTTPFPPTAQLATAQGQYVGKLLPSILRKGAITPFTFKSKGVIASLGKGEAVGCFGTKKLVGTKASFFKKLIDLRWLFLLGGISLVWRKGKSYFYW